MRFFLFAAGAFVAAAGSLAIQRETGAPYWAFYPIAIVVALLLLAASAILTQIFISRRVGFDASDVGDGTQAWELTAGIGLVPKWVSFIGLAGLCFALAVPFELVARLFR